MTFNAHTMLPHPDLKCLNPTADVRAIMTASLFAGGKDGKDGVSIPPLMLGQL